MRELYLRWRARRELRKAARFVERFADSAPSVLFGSFLNKDGTPMDHIQVRNMLLRAAAQMRKA